MVYFFVIGIVLIIAITAYSLLNIEIYNIVLSTKDLGKTYDFLGKKYIISKSIEAGQTVESVKNSFFSKKSIIKCILILDIDQLDMSYNEIAYLLQNTKYTTYSELHKLLREEENTKQIIKDTFSLYPTHYFFSEKTENITHRFLDIITYAEQLRTKSNEEYVSQQLKKYKSYFDTLEKYSLEEKQRLSILHDEDNNLIIAGAGTGKTSTIIGKALHLINNNKIPEKDILVLSYSKKAVNELKERFLNHGVSGIDIKTFHKLGNEIIKSGKVILDPEKNEKINILNKIFTEDILTDVDFSEKIINYFAYYLKEFKYNDGLLFDETTTLSNKEKINHYYNYLKENKDTFLALDGTLVKSPDEVRIANFLCLHNIKYEYEPVYKDRKIKKYLWSYRPDFYLSDYDLFLEHFSLYEDGETSFFGDKYVEERNSKINRHIANGTKLIQTYSFEFKHINKIETILTNKLKKYDVKINDIDYALVVEKMIKKNKEYSLFIPLISTFIGLFKANNFVINDLRQEYSDDRNTSFLDVFECIYNNYQEELYKDGKIDFDDMIGEAIQYIERGKYRHNYKYILVDEFQDISRGRYLLLKGLRNLSDGCKLFCVGDDWQSIYRFAGSDISIFRNFSNDIGYTKEIRLDICWRFPANINEISSSFIQENPLQIKKELISRSSVLEPIQVIYLANNQIEAGIRKICNRHINENKLLLSRYNHTNKINLDDIKNIEKMSVHKSKGLEADVVILNMTNEDYPYTFPSGIADDSVLNMVLSESNEIKYAEERRLFYVALTRTKKMLYIITSKDKSNIFLDEIKDYNLGESYIKTFGETLDKENIYIKSCPECGGKLFIRENSNDSKKQFLGCEYYPYCGYTENI